MAIFAAVALEARADLINITQDDVNQAAGGVTIKANYDVAGIMGLCPGGNIRFIQQVSLTDGSGNPKNGVPGYPNSNFIDPQPNQGNPGDFDNQPWYDATYNNAANRDANTNRQYGSGSYYYDKPAGWGAFKPVMFSATAAVVCIDTSNCTFQILAGFTWGFSIAADGTVTNIPAMTTVMNDAATRKLFNDSLATGPATFSKWKAVQSVPEPSSIVLAGLGLVGLRTLRARRKRVAA